jgi:uncharacterized damage-inducible protein DinB
MNEKSNALADRLEQGSRALAEFASALTDEEWQTPIPHDGRTIGVVVHHVASVYPIEIELAQTIAGGKPVVGVTSEVINSMNASHAEQNRDVIREEALALLRRNSQAAAAAIRSLTEEDLNRAAPVSLYSDAPLTCQFVLEDHAVRHSYHHFALIRAALTEVFMQF